jgi:sarcosine oxidase subunit gamma
VTVEVRPLAPKLRIQRMPGTAPSEGGALPRDPNSTRGEGPWVLWLSPNEWLAYAVEGPVASLHALVEPGVRSGSHVIADVTSGLTLIELSGPRAVDLVATDCGLDLEGGAVPPARCAQSHFQQVPITLHRPSAGDPWRLFVDRALSQFLCDSLCSRHEVRNLRSP